METQLEVVSKIKHKDYSYLPLNLISENFLSVSHVTSCSTCFPELQIIASNFPLIFTKKDKKKFKFEVLFSFIKNKNPFINKNGKWLGKYIPVHLRCIPFILRYNEKKTHKFLSFIFLKIRKFQRNYPRWLIS